MVTPQKRTSEMISEMNSEIISETISEIALPSFRGFRVGRNQMSCGGKTALVDNQNSRRLRKKVHVIQYWC